MFKRLSKSRAQTTLEYAVLIGVLVAALIAMQIYIKRGYQGKLRESADSMGEQFSPKLTDYSYTITSGSTSKETLSEAGTTTTEITNQSSDKSGSENVGGLDSETLF